MAPTPDQASAGYHSMWTRAKILPEKKSAADSLAGRILANRERYESIEAKTGVPWFMIAALHYRESSPDFHCHLHNGDSLFSRTRHVPAGRPATGKPPFTFEVSAIDALTMTPHNLDQVKNWSIERILYESEKYNGWGYLGRGPSPYLWSWSTEYTGGKYVADHTYDPSAWDKQAGCAALLMALASRDPAVADRLNRRETVPPGDVINKATENSRAARGVSGAVAAGAAITHGVEYAGTAEHHGLSSLHISPLATITVAAVALAIMVGAAVVVARKYNLILTQWK